MLKQQRNCVFATNSDFLIPISLQHSIVDLWYFKLWIVSNNLSLKYLRFTPSSCKDKKMFWLFKNLTIDCFVTENEYMYGLENLSLW